MSSHQPPSMKVKTSSGEKSEARRLDQFYTSHEVAQTCWDHAIGVMKETGVNLDKVVFVEPSAGKGAFFELMPATRRLGWDIDPRCEGVTKADFLTTPWDHALEGRETVVVGNPPFGKNASLAVAFFNRSAEQASWVAFIVPKTFEKDSLQRRLNLHMHLVSSWDVPAMSFELEDQVVDVPCVFQVWRRLPEPRIVSPRSVSTSDFSFVKSATEADFSFQRVGVNAGAIKGPQEGAEASHYRIKAHREGVREILASIDWSRIKYKTAGNPSISKGELVREYELRLV